MMNNTSVADFNKISDILRIGTDLESNPADDFDYFSVFKKYQDITGNNLMEELIKAYKNGNLKGSIIEQIIQEELSNIKRKDYNIETYVQDRYNQMLKGFNQVKSFDIKTSQIKDLLPSVNRQVLSDTEFNETINQSKYNVKLSDNSIIITRNGETHSIKDIKGADKNNMKILFNMNAESLFQIAKKKIKVIFEEKTTFIDPFMGEITAEFPGGQYIDYDNSIHIRPKKLNTDFISHALVHEVGHSIYIHSIEKNPALQKAFDKEYENWKNSDEVLKEAEKYQHLYCLTNLNEMFAEAYVLIVTGRCDSEYTIAKYFPKTFAIIKKIVEERY